MSAPAPELNAEHLLLIVVGAHLRAEMQDRPLAYHLRDRIAQWQRDHEGDEAGEAHPLTPMVCTDVWYLNNQELLQRPAIALGEPGVNAATAYLSNRLPTALVVDHTLRVHLDPEFVNVQACLWGVDSAATATAIDMFIERYLDEFMGEAMS